MKKVFMIAPYEALSGNASGNQVLEYAENNNPAFEAPTGRNYARNYKPRYVISRRGDGTIYFSVKTKSATKITAQSKLNMALLGGVAAIKSAIKSQATSDWTKLHNIYDYVKEHTSGVGSFNQWLDAYLRRMLQYKQENWSITVSGNSVTVKNPWALHVSDVLIIDTNTFAKFLPELGFTDENNITGGYFDTIYLDGKPLLVPVSINGQSQRVLPTWGEMLGDVAEPPYNTNYSNMCESAGLSILSSNVYLYNATLYAPDGTAQDEQMAAVANTKYTTIQPTA